jgi:hypothetical protein
MTHKEATGNYVKGIWCNVTVKRVWSEGSVVGKSEMHLAANRRT